MLNKFNDTIAAISTPIGVGGIGVIRISGTDAVTICEKIFRAKNGKILTNIPSHTAVFGTIFDYQENIIDEGLALKFNTPHSYTGEDTVELSLHGSTAVLKLTLDELIRNGARLATNGEFTKRAFLNGKMDLSKAEAVIDIINSETKLELLIGQSQLRGTLSNEVNLIRNRLLSISSHILALIDYPEEDIEALDIETVKVMLLNIFNDVQKLVDSYKIGKMIKSGIKVIITGKPNVGKSSLLNAILKEERAIVTDIPGTTRDVLEECIDVDGVKMILMDTAGIRTSEDIIENKGIKIALDKLKESDIVLFIIDANTGFDLDDLNVLSNIKDKPKLCVINKTDLNEQFDKHTLLKYFSEEEIFEISALKNIGVHTVLIAIKNKFINSEMSVNDAFLTSSRHFECLTNAKNNLQTALDAISSGMSFDVILIDIEDAISALGEISGMTISDEIVERIFANFCLGK